MDKPEWTRHFRDRELLQIRGVTIRLSAIIFIFGGLVLVGTSFYLDQASLKIWHALDIGSMTRQIICAGILRTIGATFFAVGLVDVLVEFPNVVKYIRARIQDALIEHGPVFNKMFDDLLKRDVGDPAFLADQPDYFIERVRHNIIVRRLHTEVDPLWQSYVTLARDIEPLLAGVVYKNLKIDITNEVKRDRGVYVRSERYYRAEYATHAERELDLGFSRTLRPLGGLTHSEQYQLRELLVNDAPAAETIAYSPADNGDYTATLALHRTIKPGETLVVERREIALLPPTDIYIWVCRPERSLLCLSVDVRFINEDLYPRIQPLGFPKDGDRPAREYAREAHLTWEGWMLPHHGFVISWNDPAKLAITPRPVAGTTETKKALPEGAPS